LYYTIAALLAAWRHGEGGVITRQKKEKPWRRRSVHGEKNLAQT